MKRIITYGTFDLFHEGHLNLLKRAKDLGDYLLVGVTSESYDNSRGKLNVQDNLMKRIDNVLATGLVDEVIIEEYEGQKINDILKYNINIFAIGSDWFGKFDYLKEYCEVVYLERTKGVSSTYLREKNNGILKLGVVGYGRIANRFIPEAKFVSGVNVEGVFGPNKESLINFYENHQLMFWTLDYEEFLNRVDAVYIASPHQTHYEYIKHAIQRKKHVLCEKPMVLFEEQARELYELAQKNNCVLIEAIKTGYSPGFNRLISTAKSGLIGKIKSVDATFTKLVSGQLRELNKESAGGSVNELASYPLLAIIKLLGEKIESVNYYTHYDQQKEVDLFTQINIKYKNAIATAKVGLGVKSEGDLVISGTKGYIYVPAPWWKTEYFEIRYEKSSENKKIYYKFDGEGLRYELSEFVKLINSNHKETYKLLSSESISIIRIIEQFSLGKNVQRI
ncbi:cytidyltransferase-related domain protein [Evansella cellulosilytica DSM 2522]|uniref:Cytidyltransferase-related domain protein n=1 Tax=Evansella cellulosilytica (strain ATCC 21833 / DSM 2522 / FERM P-1141 / JCM 9156 / N-4) TaxID=649639 RepID=E6TS84_EVAC2|nr:cytidyltransferase-related domain protein [Evansella cellulosilytica DSM 2522]